MEMTRRKMFAVTSAAALTTLTRSALGGWEPSERYPAIKSLDPSFNRYRLNASIERLATGMRWCEGPVYFGDGRSLIWSDIPNNRLMRYDEVTGAVSVYREPSNPRQRQPARPPRPPRHLRARDAADHAD